MCFPACFSFKEAEKHKKVQWEDAFFLGFQDNILQSRSVDQVVASVVSSVQAFDSYCSTVI